MWLRPGWQGPEAPKGYRVRPAHQPLPHPRQDIDSNSVEAIGYPAPPPPGIPMRDPHRRPGPRPSMHQAIPRDTGVPAARETDPLDAQPCVPVIGAAVTPGSPAALPAFCDPSSAGDSGALGAAGSTFAGVAPTPTARTTPAQQHRHEQCGDIGAQSLQPGGQRSGPERSGGSRFEGSLSATPQRSLLSSRPRSVSTYVDSRDRPCSGMLNFLGPNTPLSQQI